MNFKYTVIVGRHAPVGVAVVASVGPKPAALLLAGMAACPAQLAPCLPCSAGSLLALLSWLPACPAELARGLPRSAGSLLALLSPCGLWTRQVGASSGPRALGMVAGPRYPLNPFSPGLGKLTTASAPLSSRAAAAWHGQQAQG